MGYRAKASTFDQSKADTSRARIDQAVPVTKDDAAYRYWTKR